MRIRISCDVDLGSALLLPDVLGLMHATCCCDAQLSMPTRSACVRCLEIADGTAYDSKSDVWALGVVLYELMALKHPFTANGMTVGAAVHV